MQWLCLLSLLLLAGCEKKDPDEELRQMAQEMRIYDPEEGAKR